MRIAIIDLGTNSVRFDIQQLGPGRRQVRQLHREKIMVRLGQGVFLHGKLDRSAIQRTTHAFVRFHKLAQKFKAGKIIAFGTSALREVADRDRFLKLLKERSGIQVRVISGSEEAQLIALGILSNEKLHKERFGLIDIGGGSTEISICRGKDVLHSESFPLGTARLQQVFLKKSPPDPGSVYELRHFIRGTLSSVILPAHWPAVDRLLGSSGTIKALAKILKGSEWKPIDRADLGELVERMSTMTTTELLGINGIESRRVDMILAGAILLEECLDMTGAARAVTTEYSLRDGILEEELRLYEQGGDSHLALHLPDLREKALHFGADPAHLDRMVALGGSIFRALARVHQLKPAWEIYLSAAILLRDTGEAISLSGHERHSYYIVKNSDFPGAESWEIDFVAELCRYHEGAKIAPEELSFGKSRARSDAFMKILALLRVVDALDSGSESRVRLKSSRIGRDHVSIQYTGRGLTGLESLNVEKAALFFERVFRHSLSAEKV